MKPALVLGLALAANSMAAGQADNELIMAPTDKLSRDLAQRFPGKIMFDDELFYEYPPVELFGSYEEWLSATKNYRLSRDDATDDELTFKLGRPLPAEHVAYDDELPFLPKYHEFGQLADDELFPSGPTTIIVRIISTDDELADGEFAFKLGRPLPAENVANDDELPFLPKDLVNQDGIRRFYTPYFDKETGTWKVLPYQSAQLADDELSSNGTTVIIIRFDSKSQQVKDAETTDNELSTADPHVTIIKIPSSALQLKDDEVADDELGVKFVHPPVEHVAYDDDELLVRPLVPHIAADDDEFTVIPRSKETLKSEEGYQKYLKRAFVTYDNVADDELHPRVVHRPAAANRSAYAFDDDELSFMPIPPKVFATKEWFKTTKTTPEALIRDDEADNELVFTVKAPKVVVDKSLIKPVKNTETLVKDDEADDELAYLGQLIRDGGFIPRLYTDDEVRAEKPSHIKAEERTQFKSELIKKQRKLRPHPDVIPMAEN